MKQNPKQGIRPAQISRALTHFDAVDAALARVAAHLQAALADGAEALPRAAARIEALLAGAQELQCDLQGARALYDRAKSVLDEEHAAGHQRIVSWYAQPEARRERFASIVGFLRTKGPEEPVAISELAERLNLSDAETPAERVREAERKLSWLSVGNIAVRLQPAGQEAHFTLSAEARALISQGLFAALGVPADTSTPAQLTENTSTD